MPRKKTVNNYFDESVEQAIQNYIQSDNGLERNRLFKIIYPALCKIAEVWHNKIKPPYITGEPLEIQADCVIFLLEKLPMIKTGKGKAFSYLTVTARNYYILKNNTAYRDRKRMKSIEMDENFDIAMEEDYSVEIREHKCTLFDSFMEYVNDNFNSMFDTKQQKIFGESLFKNINETGYSDEFNLRAMLNNIAKETKLPRGIVRKHLNRVSSFYFHFKLHFEKYGVKPQFKQRVHLTESDKEYIKRNYRHYSNDYGISGLSRKLGVSYEVVKNYITQSHI